ncbi:spindle and centriole-associated protein 1-like [Physella acuta]|uniref:spindle and centriole-associated protein 1-like n=1 Tax=Physella acuta TaxID=109671 RepID=UPI0027DD699C|nr:spindle and centriole-associated protein 1-like [Physella acuta]XP_059142950.1 spindle and centriole-associated protein 1-like [Physella acuta]XP_059142951.1 spindle and centriole-associated protein 1-like [Physella acuta]
MSFYRVGYSRRKTAPFKTRPEWDDTVHDLTVHRATPEEVYLRKEAHKSKNHMSIKLEKLRKEKQKSRLTEAESHQLAIIKEVLYDQEQLQHVLAKSDTMMSVVKDLFGDDPKRFMGFPNVTSAPHQSDTNGTNSLVASVPDIYTRTEKLSDSVMDQSALNDIESGSDSDYGEVKRPNPISFESKMDLKRFQEYLREEERQTGYMEPPSSFLSQQDGNHSKSRFSVQSHPSYGTTEPLSFSTVHSTLPGKPQKDATHDAKIMAALMAVAAANNVMPGPKTPPRNQNPPLPSENSPPSAMNDTQKVKRSKCTTKSQNDSVCSVSNMNDLKKVLQDLENDISTYEQQTGRVPQEEFKKTSTFSGYTTALVSAVSRLTRYLKETDLRLQTEITLREQLMQDVYQLKSVIDALSTDLIVTQEEYGKLYSEHQRYRESTEKEITSIKVQLSEVTECLTGEKMLSNHTSQQDLKKLQSDQRQQVHETANISSTSRKSEESRTSTPVLDNQIPVKNVYSSCVDGPLATQRQKAVESSSSTAAVLLSPPIRKTRVSSRPDIRNYNNNHKGQKLSSQRQSSLIDLAQLACNDPPRLTQAPPVMNTVSVPRPVPLVQSNMNPALAAKANLMPEGEGQIPGDEGDGQRFTDHRAGLQKPLPLNDLADLVRLGDETEQQIQQLQELAVEETMNNPAMQSLMQTQIAELNRQQEEAKRRLLDLLDNQRLQHLRLQEQYDPAMTDQDLPHSYAEQNVYNHRYHSKQQTTVSPPISPIPQQNERSNSRNSDKAMFQGNGIKISIPTIDLDSSRDSVG